MKASGFVVGACVLVLSVGCASRQRVGDVDAGFIIPPMVADVKMAQDQQFLFPSPIGRNALPQYPAALIALGLPEQVVCLRMVVDESGAVASSETTTDGEGCAAGKSRPRPEFEQAARSAVAAWEFLAATVCTYPAGVEKNEECAGEGVTMQPVPVSLSYRFRFRWVDGKAVVER